MKLLRPLRGIVLLDGLLVISISLGVFGTDAISAVNGARQVATIPDAEMVQDGDADGDGVPDCADICPGTVPGSPVDSVGCPPVILGDCDRDTDVDQSDFGIFQRCYSGSGKPADPSCIVYGAHISKTWRSDCLPGHPPLRDGDDYPWCGKDEIEVTVQGRSLQVTHRNATYNCCPDDIHVTLDPQGSFLRFQEKELLTMGCHCLCCYDVTTAVEGLTPGVYRVEYCWLDDDYGSMCLTEDVTVAP